jgi:hypothetical protein
VTAIAATFETPVLDLALHFPAGTRSRRMVRLAALAALVMALGLAIVAARSWAGGDDASDRLRVPLAQQQFVGSLNVDDKSELLVEGADAEARNAAIPVSALPVEQVAAFQTAADAGTYNTALRCLTQAVYYEAANEPLQGRRAVAQVVLNRMRHPAYPHSVCGVVYQGAERRTGCQFSFTCDGSLLRGPMAAPWREAEAVARAALAGTVEPSVGTATHYHADYVLPKWAFQLGKIDQIGRHIFYRFNGGWGRASALAARYAGHEAIPALNFAALRERLAARPDSTLGPSEQFVPGLTVAPAKFDRHAANDVGGRIDTTKQWRLTIPDPTQASSRYRAALDGAAEPARGGIEALVAAPAGSAPGASPAPPVAGDKPSLPKGGHEVAAR